MNFRDFQDIVIVGGGPIGGYIAERLASENHSVSLFEEHRSAGHPLKCAGLVSPRIFDYVSLPKRRIVQNHIYGACLHAPSGELLQLGDEKSVRAYVIDRVRLDQLLLDKAASHGATIHFQSKLVSAQMENNNVLCTFQRKGVHLRCSTSLLIGADGPHSAVRSSCGLPDPQEYLQGIGAQVSNISLDPGYVHVFLGETVAPGFFAWVIPTNDQGSAARIGLCRTPHAKTSLKQCFANLIQQPLLDGICIDKFIGGTIPLGSVKASTRDHLMIVGDAAAQVKPTSGGGLYPGLACARQCVDVVLDAFAAADFSNQKLSCYHQKWKESIGMELAKGMRFRSVFTRLSDKEFNTILHKLNTEKIKTCIERYGDIDYPSKLVLPLLSKAPSLLKLVPRLFT